MDWNACHAKAPSFILPPPQGPHASASPDSASRARARTPRRHRRQRTGTLVVHAHLSKTSRRAISQSTQIDTRSEIPTATRNSVELSMATCVCVPSVGGS